MLTFKRRYNPCSIPGKRVRDLRAYVLIHDWQPDCAAFASGSCYLTIFYHASFTIYLSFQTIFLREM